MQHWSLTHLYLPLLLTPGQSNTPETDLHWLCACPCLQPRVRELRQWPHQAALPKLPPRPVHVLSQGTHQGAAEFPGGLLPLPGGQGRIPFHLNWHKSLVTGFVVDASFFSCLFMFYIKRFFSVLSDTSTSFHNNFLNYFDTYCI